MTDLELLETAIEESRNAISALNDGLITAALKHLRAANSAAQSLERRVAGVPPPKEGEQ